MSAVSQRVGWTFIFVAALFTTIIVSRYLTFDPDVYFEEQRETYIEHRIGIITHIVGGMIAMFVGPFQFIQGLRKKKPNLHRWMGRLYLAGCAAGGLGGLYMATFAHGGFPSGLGFGCLAVAWLICGGMALQRAMTSKISAHREWMVRSYALTFAAFTLRVWLILYQILSGAEVVAFPFTEAYIAIAWFCWVPNLIAAECYVNLSRKTQTA